MNRVLTNAIWLVVVEIVSVVAMNDFVLRGLGEIKYFFSFTKAIAKAIHKKIFHREIFYSEPDGNNPEEPKRFNKWWE